MANEIIYGVGRTALRDFVDKTKVVALSKLKNVNVEMTSNEEPLFGGDSPYAFATFPKDKSIKASAENATFSIELMNTTQGATITTGAVNMTEIRTIIIPADGEVVLDPAPIADSVSVSGYTEGTAGSLTTGQFAMDTVETDTIDFAIADAGKEVDIIYQYAGSATAKTMSITKDSLAKPVEFTHIVDIFNDNNVKVAVGMLVIYKAKANNSWNFNLEPQKAFAPKVEFEALDPKRPDGKLWDFVVNPVT